MAAPKHPYLRFYTGDWQKDPAVSLCSAATRGIWVDLLCAMHNAADRGRLVGTVAQLSRVARCTPEEMQSALSELDETGAASVTCHGDVTDCHSKVTVENRRMRRETEETENARLRKRRERERKTNSEACHADVTSLCHCHSHKDPLIVPPEGGRYPAEFEEWWEHYPKGSKVGKGAAARAWKRLGAARPPTRDLVAALGRQKSRDPKWRPDPRTGETYIPNPATWLNQHRWEDDTAKPAESRAERAEWPVERLAQFAETLAAGAGRWEELSPRIIAARDTDDGDGLKSLIRELKAHEDSA